MNFNVEKMMLFRLDYEVTLSPIQTGRALIYVVAASAIEALEGGSRQIPQGEGEAVKFCALHMVEECHVLRPELQFPLGGTDELSYGSRR